MTFPRVQLLSSEAAWRLLQNKNARVVPVDATWYMPNNPKNPVHQFNSEDRIPKSVFFDLDKVALPESKYPHMLPPQRLFDSSVAALGISKQDSVLVYDRSGIFSGPRAAWTFALYGHENVYLLDHYPLFKAHHSVERGPPETPAPSEYGGIGALQFSGNYRKQVIDFDELSDLVSSGESSNYVIFDARSKDRFTGAAPEPRPGLPSGHIDGAFNLPFTKVLNADGHYKSKQELQKVFEQETGVDLPSVLQSKAGAIVMCGTGVTAVILRLAIERVVENANIRVYDGSWTEWAQRAPHLVVKD